MIDSTFGYKKNPSQMGEFFYFTGVVVNRIAGVGFSTQM